MSDNVAVTSGELIQIETTGGGGWGDPLERDPAAVSLDVAQDKVSRTSAEVDYGVILTPDGEVDETATQALRVRMRSLRDSEWLFDRGPGYLTLAGSEHAEVDR